MKSENRTDIIEEQNQSMNLNCNAIFERKGASLQKLKI